MADTTVKAGRAPWAREPVYDGNEGYRHLAEAKIQRHLDDLAGLLRGGRERSAGGNVVPYAEEAATALAFLADADWVEFFADAASTTVVRVQRDARWRLRRAVCLSLRRELARRLKTGC